MKTTNLNKIRSNNHEVINTCLRKTTAPIKTTFGTELSYFRVRSLLLAAGSSLLTKRRGTTT